jgi:hypothetical protein
VLLLLLVLGALGRTYRITDPVFGWHGFRQHDTAAIARNFYDGSLNILYPQVDWRGNSPGYVESEFPIYTGLTASLYRIVGPHEWVGRALNIFFYILSGFLLFALSRRAFGWESALCAVFFYSIAPLAFYFNRSFQPDTLLALCSLGGIYFFWKWTDEERQGYFWISLTAVAIAILIKPPSLYLGLPLLYLSFVKFGPRFFLKPGLWLFAVLAIAPSIAWYAHSFSLWQTYGNTFGLLGRSTIAGIWSITDRHWWWLAENLSFRLLFQITTPIGLVFLIVGLFSKHPSSSRVLLAWLAGFAVYIILVPRGHWGHNYYQLPLVFMTSALMGYGVVLLHRKKILNATVLGLLMAVMIPLAALQIRDAFHLPPHARPRIAFGKRVGMLTEPDALIIFAVPLLDSVSGADQKGFLYRHRTAEGEFLYDDPYDFYYSRRKGWSLDEVQASPEFVEVLRQRGAKYFATFFPGLLRRHPELVAALERFYTPMEVTPQWVLYQLTKPPDVDSPS